MDTHSLNDQELIEAKDLAARSLADEAIKKLADWTDQNNIDDEVLEKWLGEKS